MILCYVTDRHLLDESAPLDALLHRVENTAAANVEWIQIREKDLSARDLVDFTRRVMNDVHRKAAENKTQPPQIIVNDRIDAALAAGAAGVHLSAAASIPAASAVKWLRAGNGPQDFIVGVSCHSHSEAIAAEEARASYIFFGPVYETPSKESFGKPLGIEKLAEVCRAVHIRVLAIGGVTEANAPACVGAGASGIAAIRMFQQSPDPAILTATVSRLRALT